VQQFTRGDLSFDVTDAGPADAEVIVLLHGWPQDRHTFDPVIPLLTAAGYRALAFDQRGYSPGAQPTSTSSYAMAELVADVLGLLDAAGVSQAHLVGHDWGGAVAWAVAERAPDRLASLTVLSTPHPRAMLQALQHPDQLLKSWYMLAFQVPALPEAVLGATLATVLQRSGLPAFESHRYAARFRNGDTATGSLAWYRAMGAAEARRAARRVRGILPTGSGSTPDADPHITVPTTLVWGRHDTALGRRGTLGTAQWVSGPYRLVELDAGHWLPETRPREVVAAILDRVGGEAAGEPGTP
jgi:pimeloyl-ACP methyl ester carboxylesterase